MTTNVGQYQWTGQLPQTQTSGGQEEDQSIPWHFKEIFAIATWRDEATLDKDGLITLVARRFACGVAMLGLGIVGVIDVIASLALGIFTSPGLLGGNDFSLQMLKRGVKGLGVSLTALTYFQVTNIFKDKIADDDDGTNP